MNHGTPDSPAKTPIARRLNAIRKELDLKYSEFHRLLVGKREGDEEDEATYDWPYVDPTTGEANPQRPRYSYESTRRYLYEERDPPAEFVGRVADVFGVNPDWIINGADPKWRVAPGFQGRAHGGVEEAYPEAFGLLPDRAKDLFLEVLEEYVYSAPDAAEALDEETVVELGGDLLWWILIPLRWKVRLNTEHHASAEGSWGFIGAPTKTTKRQVGRYAEQVLHGLREAIPPRGQGAPLEDAPDSLLRAYRKAWEAESEQLDEWAETIGWGEDAYSGLPEDGKTDGPHAQLDLSGALPDLRLDDLPWKPLEGVEGDWEVAHRGAGRYLLRSPDGRVLNSTDTLWTLETCRAEVEIENKLEAQTTDEGTSSLRRLHSIRREWLGWGLDRLQEEAAEVLDRPEPVDLDALSEDELDTLIAEWEPIHETGRD